MVIPGELEIRRNDVSALSRFAALNAKWIEQLHHMEESDRLMVARPQIYIENGSHVFSCLLYTSDAADE